MQQVWPDKISQISKSIIATILITSTSAQSLLDLRKGHTTKLSKETRDEEVADAPESPDFKKVHYNDPLGKMSAWISQSDDRGHKHPAIIWISGGFPPGGASSSAWEAEEPDNDQSAKSYHENGMIIMYPWLRGSGGNPGKQESFYGEVDDILAAARFLAAQDSVDPKRIYLGGHSTGGTLALLAAACDFPFKAVLSFGPVHDPTRYGNGSLTFDWNDDKEVDLRSPLKILGAIKAPTLIIEGEDGNSDSLETMKKASKNPMLNFVTIKGADHFSLLRPINDHLARQLARLEADKPSTFEATVLQNAFDAFHKSRREASDLITLSDVCADGIDIRKPQLVQFYVIARDKLPLESIAKTCLSDGLKSEPLIERKDRKGRDFYILILNKSLTLTDLESLFSCSQKITALVDEAELQYDGWYVRTDNE